MERFDFENRQKSEKTPFEDYFDAFSNLLGAFFDLKIHCNKSLNTSIDAELNALPEYV